VTVEAKRDLGDVAAAGEQRHRDYLAVLSR
jgi:hypothetical protein